MQDFSGGGTSRGVGVQQLPYQLTELGTVVGGCMGGARAHTGKARGKIVRVEGPAAVENLICEVYGGEGA